MHKQKFRHPSSICRPQVLIWQPFKSLYITKLFVCLFVCLFDCLGVFVTLENFFTHMETKVFSSGVWYNIRTSKSMYIRFFSKLYPYFLKRNLCLLICWCTIVHMYFNHMIERMMQQPDTPVPMTSSVIPLYIPLSKSSAVVYVFVLDCFEQSISLKNYFER